jgi:hypothetical protein
MAQQETLFQQRIGALPTIHADYWSFSIGGAVQHPLILSYTDVLALPHVEFTCALACAAHKPDSVPLIGQARWRGVPMQALLDEVTIVPEAQHAHITAADGFSSSLPLDLLAQTLLVTAMDGAPLPLEHGAPARLILPGHAGYKMPKWVQRISLSADPQPGFWEARGWSQTGAAPLIAYFSAPQHLQPVSGTVTLAGKAYAGSRAVTCVEISVDGGPWMPVEVAPSVPFCQTTWQIEWTPPGPGDYLLRVRATAEGDSTSSADLHTIVARVTGNA